MKSNHLVLGLAVLVFAVCPLTGHAQTAGFLAGIAQPRGISPVPAPAVSVHGTFRGVPGFMPVFQPPFPGVGVQVPLVPNFPTVIVPNTVLVPGQTFIPAPTFVQPPPVVLVLPSVPVVVVPGLPLVPVPRPLFGLSRGAVLQRLGPPSTTVITSTGETLYFPSGVTVIIQNGQVVSPR